MKKKMAQAIQEEKEAAIEKGDLDQGMPFITVQVDGGWSKRSYGHSYSANSGVVSLCFAIVAKYTRVTNTVY